jgi:asparagine synthase (glutamine-hydrolysing)
MCGIVGLLSSQGALLPPLLQSMSDSLAHRGPDGEGQWHDADAGIGLGHRRLAIVDLSPAGAQPMVSASGRYVLSYNGEVFNHATLRRRLEAGPAIAWRGHSDTEVLLEAIERWGLLETLQACEGMFALALWDRRERSLALARDRLGEKPLYVGRVGADLVFASELRAFRRHPQWRHAIDPDALEDMLRLGYVPAPRSIHPGVFKLPAACHLQLRAGDLQAGWTPEAFEARCRRYWSVADAARRGQADLLGNDVALAADELRPLLDSAVANRMVADVPVGALLSGGVDSSLVVATMQGLSARPVHTYSVGFPGEPADESVHAARVAHHLGCLHTTLSVGPGEALECVPRLSEVYDEPFADAAQVPTLLVSALARRHVTVALTGDGGDEAFFGYRRYFDAEANWPRLRRLGRVGRQLLARGLSVAGQVVPAGNVTQRLLRQSNRMGAADFADYYARLISLGIPAVAGGARSPAAAALAAVPADLALGLGGRMMYFDQTLGLPEGMHTKVDRASMACALELRAPFVDHRLVEFGWRLPPALLHHDGVGKRVLRHLLHQRVPRQLVDRPKQGFDVPVAAWLRGPLRGWALDLLSPASLAAGGHLDAERVDAMLRAHLSGRADFGQALWALLMFQSWQVRHA